MAASKRAAMHPIMKRALAIAPPASHPKMIQAGGPAVRVVKFEGPACLSIAAWSTSILEPTLTTHERTQYDRWMKMACDSPQPKYDAMSVARPVGASQALVAAAICVGTRRCAAGGYDSHAQREVADLVELVIGYFGSEEAEGDSARSSIQRYLIELDDRLMGYELAAAAREKGGAEHAEFERVLWRGGDAKENCAMWVARINHDKYALLSKVGARWKWNEGRRDDVLASVPDTFFESATRVAIERDLPLNVKLRLPLRGKDKDNFWTVDVVDRH